MNTLLEFMNEFKQYEMMITGFGLASLGILSYWTKHVYSVLIRMVKYNFIAYVQIDSTSPDYETISKWFTINISKIPTRRLLVSTAKVYGRLSETVETTYTFAPGKHYYWYKRRLFFVNVIQSAEHANSERGAFYQMTIGTYGRSLDTIKSFISDVKNSVKNDKDTLSLYYPGSIHHANPWELVRVIYKRYRNSLFISEGVFDKIYNEVRLFFTPETKADCIRKGIRYKRGYLLYGPPGTGKSSFIHVLSTELEMPIYYLSMKNMLNDKELFTYLRAVQPKSLIVMEDIDACDLFIQREDDSGVKPSGKNSGISLAGLLNCLDGLLTPNEVVFVITTNYLDRMDRALIRKGRIDSIIHMGYMSKQNIIDMCKVIPDEPVYITEDEIPHVSIVGADLQSVLMTPDATKENVLEFLNSKK